MNYKHFEVQKFKLCIIAVVFKSVTYVCKTVQFSLNNVSEGLDFKFS